MEIIERIEAEGSYPSIGLESGHEYNEEFTPELKKIFVQHGFAKQVFSDNRPLKISIYEEKVFSKNMFVIRQNKTYVSMAKTSNTWVRAEWKLVSGTEDYIAGQMYSQGNEVYNLNAIYRANTNTSNTWVASEWDLVLQGA